MVDARVTDLTEITSTASGDFIYIVDVSDLTDNAAGSSRKIQVGNLLPAGGATQLSELSDVNTSTPTNRFVLVADGTDFESRLLVEADISDLQSYITEVSSDSTPVLGGDLDASDNDITGIKLAEFQDEHDNGNSGASFNVNWTNGNNQKITLNNNTTLSFTNPVGAARVQLKIVQDGVGTRTITWPANVKFAGGTAPTLTTSATAEDIITFYWDGTDYYAIEALDFQ